MDHDKLYYGGCNFRIKRLKCLFDAKHKFDVNNFHVANTHIHKYKQILDKEVEKMSNHVFATLAMI